MKWTFYGGVREVTGSKHILEVGREKVLFDCGMFQGKRSESVEKNSHLPFNAISLRSVVLSHAHIDHCGILPVLVQQGFRGPIYATSATCDVASHMLMDSAKIQTADAKFINKKHKKRGLPPIKILYGIKQAEKTITLLRKREYGKEFDAAPGVQVRFLDAGHILGSAVCEIKATENSSTVKIGYAVDLGRKNLPILRDPQHMEGLDYLVIESTYGNRLHDKIENASAQLTQIINNAYRNSGKIIIPAFALERTQEIIYILNELWNKRNIPAMHVYVDSPLASKVTEVFRRHSDCFDTEAKLTLQKDSDLFGYQHLTFIRDVRESKKLNNSSEPCIIIAASGMCEGGRVVHHLRNNIQNPSVTILIVGFAAKHTLARKIVEQQPVVRIFGDEHRLRAKVVVLDAFSAHADRNDLINYAKHTSLTLKGAFIVHGEEDQSESLADALTNEDIPGVRVPAIGESIDLT
ncbi:MAG: MBL fold metallo-hydrolase [Planctomycetota bacterium]